MHSHPSSVDSTGMPAGNYDLYIEQGATLRFSAVYGYKDGTLDVDGNENVLPYDLAGCRLRMQIRQRQGGLVYASATTSNGGIVINTPTTDGKFTVTLTDELTDTFTFVRGKWDLEVGWPSGDVARILQGKVTVSPNITQDADLEDISTGLGAVYDVGEQDVDVDTLIDAQPGTG